MNKLASMAAVALVLCAAAPAGAHAVYKSSDPADESTVHKAPQRVTAEFSEPPTSDSYMEIFDACGEQVDLGDSEAVGYELRLGMDGAACG